MRVPVTLLTMALAFLPVAAAGEIVLPPGFTSQIYVTGNGFDSDTTRSGRGIPAVSTLAFDESGALYLARTGRRYTAGEVYDLWPLYRIPPGGARLTSESDSRYLYGPPLRNAQVAAIRGGRELLVTTFDRERRIGVLYRMLDGRAELFAGGTPASGAEPLLRQPEGAAIDSAGNIYVADRDQGRIVRLDATGRVLDPRHVAVTRPRVLAIGEGNQLWIGADGGAEAPWQQGPGEIWRVTGDGPPALILRGPMPAAIAAGPKGLLFVADRQGARVFAIDGEGKRVEFARFTEEDAPRGLGFAPVTAGTRKAGIAGDLFVVVVRRGAWPANEVIRISGPFEELGKR